MLWNGEVKFVADTMALPIPLGSLCCFKPLGNTDVILFGHIAGVMVHDFEKMSFVYLLKCEERTYYSAEVIRKPKGVTNAREAEKYFRMSKEE